MRFWTTWSIERCPCLWQGSQDEVIFQVTSKPCYDSVMILWRCYTAFVVILNRERVWATYWGSSSELWHPFVRKVLAKCLYYWLQPLELLMSKNISDQESSPNHQAPSTALLRSHTASSTAQLQPGKLSPSLDAWASSLTWACRSYSGNWRLNYVPQ